MAINRQSVGRDYAIGLYDNNTSNTVDLGIVEGWKSSAKKHDIKSMPYNAPPLFGYIPDGYGGHFTLKRTNPNLENLFLQLVALFNSGGDLLPGYINQTTRNYGGTYSRYQYKKAVFFLTEDADVTREKVVPMTVEWMASEKVVVA